MNDKTKQQYVIEIGCGAIHNVDLTLSFNECDKVITHLYEHYADAIDTVIESYIQRSIYELRLGKQHAKTNT